MKPLSAPYYAEVALTARCNLACPYCHFRNSASETANELSTEEWLNVFAELGELKLCRLTLSGGEILLRDDLPRLIEGACRNHLRYSFLSNGWLFEERHAEMLKESKRCNLVQISIDGTEKEHDAIRGAGSFSRAIRAVEIIRRHRLPLQVRLTVGKANLGTLMDTARFLLDEIGLPSVAVNWAQHFTSKNDTSDLRHLLSIREQLQCMVEIKEVQAAYPGRFGEGKSGFKHLAARWNDILNRRELVGGALLRCPAHLERIAIRADGAITPCNHISHVVLGYVGRDRIMDLWRNSPILNEMRAHDCDPASTFPACRECEYNPYCRPAWICYELGERATPYCLKQYQEAAPDFDFGALKWKKNA